MAEPGKKNSTSRKRGVTRPLSPEEWRLRTITPPAKMREHPYYTDPPMPDDTRPSWWLTCYEMVREFEPAKSRKDCARDAHITTALIYAERRMHEKCRPLGANGVRALAAQKYKKAQQLSRRLWDDPYFTDPWLKDAEGNCIDPREWDYALALDHLEKIERLLWAVTAAEMAARRSYAWRKAGEEIEDEDIKRSAESCYRQIERDARREKTPQKVEGRQWRWGITGGHRVPPQTDELLETEVLKCLALRDWVATLSSQQQEAIRLHLEGWTDGEIADKQRREAGAVKQERWRLIRRARQLLGKS
jgi:hypothetical protein